jgi:Type VI secretion system/phage-baseplate injector OB domain
MKVTRKYYGKYRGTVIDNADPLKKGRIQVQVADVTQLLPSTWAEACVPFTGGITPSGVYAVPPIGADVWVEFEKGDIRYPIWSGCFWGSQESVPTLALADPPGLPSIILQTTGQKAVVLSDVTGIILTSDALSYPLGASITITDAGISIQDALGGSIVIAGGEVSINGTALVITK